MIRRVARGASCGAHLVRLVHLALVTRVAVVAVAALVALGGAGDLSRAAEPGSDARAALERARLCWAALDPECTEGELAVARAGLATLSPAEQAEALRLSAEVALAADDGATAHTHLLALLERDPAFAPATWPEPWRAALAAARKAAPDRLPPHIQVTPPDSARPGRPLELEALVDDAGGVARCEILFADGARVVMLSADGSVFRGVVDKARLRTPSLELAIEAIDRAGNRGAWPASGGLHVLPVVAPKAPPSPPITERWWFWTTIGVVVAGGVTALVLALDGGDDTGEVGREGRIDVVYDVVSP